MPLFRDFPQTLQVAPGYHSLQFIDQNCFYAYSIHFTLRSSEGYFNNTLRQVTWIKNVNISDERLAFIVPNIHPGPV